MSSLSIIILTKNEEANLPDCLASIATLDAEVHVVDSGSTDRTMEIARTAGCKVSEHPFENYAAQRNWALRELPIATEWILNLDADERLTPSLAREVQQLMADPPAHIDGFMLRKRTYFMGRWIRHGGHYPSFHLRFFRRGRGRCEDRLYDQHFVVDSGRVATLRNDYIDILTDSLSRWTERHNRWAELEAREILSTTTGPGRLKGKLRGTPIEKKRWLREDFYQKFPLFARPLLYFIYRYFLRLGFLDGTEGLIFHFLQGFWFRFLVDAMVFEDRKRHRATRRKPT